MHFGEQALGVLSVAEGLQILGLSKCRISAIIEAQGVPLEKWRHRKSVS